ncbi:MAG TPA: hypothetical protein VHB20_13810 [Verrucomicrobiae bacterium]|jgi:hypothetical protein|nr:hypothetical protein [Verrucomicrobiae bacterium]
MKKYLSYRNLPALAGLCTLEEAARPGLSVEGCVTRLKRYHYAFRRLHQIFNARLIAEPIYELKMGFSLHAHYCAEHAQALRTRVGEMREPPLGLDVVPDKHLEILFDEILAAPTTEELVSGVYGKVVPALQKSLRRHIADTNRLADAPSVRLCRFALLELEDMEKYGAACLASLVTSARVQDIRGWLQLLDDCLAAAGGLDGAEKPSGQTIARQHSIHPASLDKIPRRDERFPDPYNMGVNAEVFLYDETMPSEAKTLMMFYKRLREIDVPEMMASIIAETSGKPWAYYRDMSRQLWDEARHAMMGEVGFVQAGVDWPNQVMINFTWSLGLNTQLTPKERHGVLYFIEQGLMPKNGKRYEWEVGLKSHNPLSAVFQDYDWADEVLHARIGRDWYLKEFKNANEGVEYGDKCWSKVLVGWRQWRDEGLTQHRNWWPDCYQAACQTWGVTPDPRVLGYNTTYEQVRADLKNLSASA